MRKEILFAAVAIGMLASCSSDEYVGQTVVPTSHSENGAIAFGTGSGVGAITRAEISGAEAATLLNKNFVVEGIKTIGEGDSKTVSEVFDNYNVNWKENTADRTKSNTANWEYVGEDIIDKDETDKRTSVSEQTIKYWDYAASQYDFWAYSTGGGSATVSSLAHDATLGTSAYTVQVDAENLQKVYISDLVKVEPTDFNKQVSLRFRALASKIRIGLYETIPGYSVKNVKFFYPSNDETATETETATAALYASDEALPSTGTYNVSFSDEGSAQVEFGNESSDIKTSSQTYGELSYSGKEKDEKTGTQFLARNSAQPSWATATGATAGDYQLILPNANGAVLTLKVDYTLESTDGSGEEITIHGATALVPSQFTQWKPNFAYTYIFKISDNTNGQTHIPASGEPDVPAGLYPITFDAVAINSEDGTQETITTVATPSITTYSVTSTVTESDEYKTSDNIYVTVTENGTLLSQTDKSTLYKVTKSSANYVATEAEVLDALNTYTSKGDDGIYVGRNGITLTPATITSLTEISIPLVDNTSITVASGDVAKLSSLSAGTYAFVYEKTAPTTSKAKFQAVTITTGDSVEGYYTKSGDTYTEASDTAVEGTTYYAKYTENSGVYAVKIIKVVASGS